jgi:hypothetical protein
MLSDTNINELKEKYKKNGFVFGTSEFNEIMNYKLFVLLIFFIWIEN